MGLTALGGRTPKAGDKPGVGRAAEGVKGSAAYPAATGLARLSTRSTAPGSGSDVRDRGDPHFVIGRGISVPRGH